MFIIITIDGSNVYYIKHRTGDISNGKKDLL